MEKKRFFFMLHFARSIYHKDTKRSLRELMLKTFELGYTCCWQDCKEVKE